MPDGKIVNHDGEIIKFIRSFKKFNQHGAGNNMGISQQAFAKWEKTELIPENKKSAILKALNSSPKEFEGVKNPTSPPRKT